MITVVSFIKSTLEISGDGTAGVGGVRHIGMDIGDIGGMPGEQCVGCGGQPV